MLRVLAMTAVSVMVSITGSHAQSATETLGFLVGGYDTIPAGQTSNTVHHDEECTDKSKTGCYYEDTYTQIDNCHYSHKLTMMSKWIVTKTFDDKNGVPTERKEEHLFNEDFSQAAMLTTRKNYDGKDVAAIVGGEKLVCAAGEADTNGYCANYMDLRAYPAPVDPVRAKAAFVYFQDRFCKGRAF